MVYPRPSPATSTRRARPFGSASSPNNLSELPSLLSMAKAPLMINSSTRRPGTESTSQHDFTSRTGVARDGLDRLHQRMVSCSGRSGSELVWSVKIRMWRVRQSRRRPVT